MKYRLRACLGGLSLGSLCLASPASASDFTGLMYIIWGGIIVIGAIVGLIIWAIIKAYKS